MCLDYDAELTKKGLKGRKVYPDGSVKVWKLLRIKDKQLVSPWKDQVKWIPGWQPSDRNNKLTDDEKWDEQINHGIHVFLSREQARKYKRILDTKGSTKIVPVYVRKEDLVAVGTCKLSNFWEDWIFTSAAVFTTVFLTKKDYFKAVKIRK